MQEKVKEARALRHPPRQARPGDLGLSHRLVERRRGRPISATTSMASTRSAKRRRGRAAKPCVTRRCGAIAAGPHPPPAARSAGRRGTLTAPPPVRALARPNLSRSGGGLSRRLRSREERQSVARCRIASIRSANSCGRGARRLLGNRGGRLHRPDRTLGRRRWTSRRWIVCLCAFKGRWREVWGAGYTELFFLDEPTALAAGHRPCFECRREAAKAFLAALPGRAQPCGPDGRGAPPRASRRRRAQAAVARAARRAAGRRHRRPRRPGARRSRRAPAALEL